MVNRIIRRFTGWFSSPANVWQTFLVCALLILLELAFPALDPHWFWLLVALTVYSSITQPPLAYGGRLAAEASERVLAEMESAIELLVQLARNETDLQEAIAAQNQAIAAALAELRTHLK